MLLRDTTVDVLALDLIIQALLHLAVRVHGTFAIGSFQLKRHVLLLGLHQHRLAFSTPLFLLLVLDGLCQLLDVVFPAFLPLVFDFLCKSFQSNQHINLYWGEKTWLQAKHYHTYVDFLVQVSGQRRSELLDGEHDHDGQRQTIVVFVFHDVDLLRAQIGH